MITLLLASAVLLGLLAFFEPCSIATHTLFSVRTHRGGNSLCCQNLLTVWLSRSALIIGLLVAAVYLIDVPQWGPFLPSIILSFIAVIYVLSRFTYIPMPHLEFYRLFPGARRIPFALKLGLTLPACTLPLIAVVAGMAVTVDSVLFASISGLLFATLFTLPMVLASIKGVNEEGADLLKHAARGSPWLTAVLLFGLALYLLVPSLDITPSTLKSSLTQASLAGIGFSFLAGFIFSFNPVSFASIPVVLAYVTRAHEERRAVLMGSAFVAGLLMTHVVLGVAAALGGEWTQNSMGREWGMVLGPVLIIMGLMWAGWLNIRLPWFGMKGRRVTGLWGAFLLGIPFTVAVCPFCTPALLVTLTASAAIGSASFGGALLLAFALGRGIPILLGAWSMGWLESLKVLSHSQKLLEVIGGVTLILTGLYLLNEYFFII